MSCYLIMFSSSFLILILLLISYSFRYYLFYFSGTGAEFLASALNRALKFIFSYKIKPSNHATIAIMKFLILFHILNNLITQIICNLYSCLIEIIAGKFSFQNCSMNQILKPLSTITLHSLTLKS